MRRIKRHLESFSFRAGCAIFALLAVLLVGQRLLIYSQMLELAYDDIRLIIDAHEEELDEIKEQDGIAHLKDVLSGMSQNMHDKHLYLLLDDKGSIAGNLKAWPDMATDKQDYVELKTMQGEGGEKLHLLTSVSEYAPGVRLLVAYDLERLDTLRQELLSSLLHNVLTALCLAFLFSVILIGLLSRHLHRFNQACERVMSGDLSHRVALRSSHDEFDMLAENINSMLDWNKALIDTVRDSTNAVAHDMRTPLSRLRLELSALLLRDDLPASLQGNIQRQVEWVDSIIVMFDNILNIAKAEARASAEMFSQFDLLQLVHDVLELYQPIAEEKGLQLLAPAMEAPFIMSGDRQLLGQAVMNLIDNACKFTPSGGTIEVLLSQESGTASLEVADSGIGMPEGLHDMATGRFFRADESRSTAGHGLGLSLVAAVAALHRGSFSLSDNQPGVRARLTVRM